MKNESQSFGFAKALGQSLKERITELEMSETITAIATGLTNSGINIIRMSGENSFPIIDQVYRSKNGSKRLSEQKGNTAHFGYIYDEDKLLDESIVVIYRSPHSYTKEDIVEINCHGGLLVTRKILQVLIKNGARLAEPGEFTKRAFLNGRIDLSQAEAVMEVIKAENDFALENSLKQLKGSLHDRIDAIRKKVISLTAFLESALDDPEHYSLEDESDRIAGIVYDCINELEGYIKNSREGKIRKNGINTVILGKPNVGKSSLMNLITGEDTAIVTEIAGTTRDAIEQSIHLGSLQLNVMDTAGIRDTSDIIEKMGVEKAMQLADRAELILYVVDASRALDINDYDIIEFIKNKNVIVLLNKTDLAVVTNEAEVKKLIDCSVLSISAKMKIGIEKIEKEIEFLLFHENKKDENSVFITNVRHIELMKSAVDHLYEVRESMNNQMPEDFYTIDLMSAYEKLGYIVGESIADDLADVIFKEFCMGK